MTTFAAAAGIVAAVGLGACTSQPSAKAVVKDVIESLDGLSEPERTCMLEAVEGYSEDDLKAIGEDNEAVDFSREGAVESQGTPGLQKFVADLQSCTGGG